MCGPRVPAAAAAPWPHPSAGQSYRQTQTRSIPSLLLISSACPFANSLPPRSPPLSLPGSILPLFAPPSFRPPLVLCNQCTKLLMHAIGKFDVLEIQSPDRINMMVVVCSDWTWRIRQPKKCEVLAVWAPINYRSGLSISNRYRLIDQ
jgi:hypothetical protein